ncbi:hypothetical protein [Streptosporangium sp. NPDC087985]|uniref:hypothetical protein n=1 Tax=Streptosporangium sp. NPDC087985 TaxID=3366196 RepID=UPI00381D2EDA
MNAPPQSSDTAADQLTALQQTYPGYRISHDAVLGHWTALRRAPLTQREQQADVKYLITRPSPERLGSALATQIELTHTLRATHSFTTTPQTHDDMARPFVRSRQVDDKKESGIDETE